MRPPLFSRAFVLLLAGCFGTIASNFATMPLLPAYVQQMGASDILIGWTVGTLPLAALVIRPFVGRLVGQGHIKSLLLAGALGFAVAPLGYMVSPNPWVLLGVRVVHGFGLGLYTTAALMLAAVLTPPDRRGEGMGWYASSLQIAMALAPLGGGIIWDRFGFAAALWFATGLGVLGALFVLPLSMPPAERGMETRAATWWSRAALGPALASLACQFTFGAVVTFLPLLMLQRGGMNPGWFFFLFAGISVLSQLAAGLASDRWGRLGVVVLGCLVTTAGILLVPGMTTTATMVLAAAVYGIGFGFIRPVIQALIVDRAPLHERGAAMAMFTASVDAGVGFAGGLLGPLVQAASYATGFYAAAVPPAVAGAVYGAVWYRARRRPAR